MAKVYPFYFYDYLGGWDFDSDEYLEDAEPADIPDEVLERYKKAIEEYVAACDAIKEYV